MIYKYIFKLNIKKHNVTLFLIIFHDVTLCFLMLKNAKNENFKLLSV
jgi:hypothetical protein